MATKKQMPKTVADLIREHPIPTMDQIAKVRLECARCQTELDVFTAQSGPDGHLCHDCVDWPRYKKEHVMRAKAVAS